MFHPGPIKDKSKKAGGLINERSPGIYITGTYKYSINVLM